MDHSSPIVTKFKELHLTDNTILHRMRNHDDDALSTLFDKYAPILYGYTSIFIRAVAEREDIIHDVFLEVWNRPPEINDMEGTFFSWLIFSTRRRIISKDREDLSGKINLDALIQKIQRIENAYPDVATIDDKRKTVVCAFFVCTPEQRQLLSLAFFEGIKGPQIGRELNLPVQTVQSRLGETVFTLYSLLSATVTETTPHQDQFKIECALHAVGALDGNDLVEFEAHLQTGCESCRADVLKYREALALLPIMFYQSSTAPELKDRVLFSAHLTVVMKSNAQKHQLPAENHSSKRETVVESAKPHAWPFSFVLIGFLTFVIIGLVVYLFLLSSNIEHRKNELTEQHALITRITENLEEKNDILEVMDSPEIQLIDLEGTEIDRDAYGKIFLSRTLHAAVLHVANLPAQPDEKEYRLWVRAGSRLVLAHRFSIDKNNAKDYFIRFEIPAILQQNGADAFSITLESTHAATDMPGMQYLVSTISTKSKGTNSR